LRATGCFGGGLVTDGLPSNAAARG
jgi:hypothetical protein